MEKGDSEDDWPTGGVTIQHVAQLLGIPLPTIRSWERRYGIPAPARTGGGHRRYDFDEAEDLRMLRDEIGRGRRPADAAAMVRSRRASGSTLTRPFVDRFCDAALHLDAAGMREILHAASVELGVEQAVVEVGLAAMREVGARWQAGLCDVGNEHLATEVMRAWLSRLVAFGPPPTSHDVTILSCGPKDLHTVGLEAFGVLLSYAGMSCRVLGALMPVSSLVRAVHGTEASKVVIVSQLAIARQAAVRSLEAVSQLESVSLFYGGGAFLSLAARKGIPGTYLGEDLLAAVALLRAA